MDIEANDPDWDLHMAAPLPPMEKPSAGLGETPGGWGGCRREGLGRVFQELAGRLVGDGKRLHKEDASSHIYAITSVCASAACLSSSVVLLFFLIGETKPLNLLFPQPLSFPQPFCSSIPADLFRCCWPLTSVLVYWPFVQRRSVVTTPG